MREILLPAHRLLHGSKSLTESDQLTIPSKLYNDLRATLVQAELVLLRVLGFELRVPLPLDFLPRYLERSLEGVTGAGEDYSSWSREELDEYGVRSSLMDTDIGKACIMRTVHA